MSILQLFNNYVYNFYIVVDKTVINEQKSCLWINGFEVKLLYNIINNDHEIFALKIF